MAQQIHLSPISQRVELCGSVKRYAISMIALILPLCSLVAEENDSIYYTDMGQCLPTDHLSSTNGPGTWRLIPYETESIQGNLIYAHSITNAQKVTLPLERTGWHRMYIGIWQPRFAYDGTMTLRLKMTGDDAYRRIQLGATADTQENTFLREIYAWTTDVTDKDLVIDKMSGLAGRCASVAYVRLEPLSPEEVTSEEADRNQRDTRNLVATIDGVSYFHYGEYSTPEDVLDQVELYRHSDVAKVLWAVTYGDRTNFPTKVPGAVFLGDHNRSSWSSDAAPNDYVRGEQQAHRALRSFSEQGAVPHALAAAHAQEMGLKFDLMFRLGILGELGFLDLANSGFLKNNPHCRQVHADGTLLDKASFAFEETQDFTLALMREALEGVDADGINLCFVRGPHMLQFEKPILAAFASQYDEDARNVPNDDPRLQAVRAEFMTRYVGKVHALVEAIGNERGRPLELSVWVWPSEQGVWLGGTPYAEGLDVKQWIKNGWLNSVLCQGGIDTEYMALGKENNCEFVLFTGYRGEKAMSPATVTQAYAEGVDAFAYWDIDAVQIMSDPWNWLRRIGHRDEMANWDAINPKSRLIPLHRVADVEVAHGLVDAVYSGG